MKAFLKLVWEMNKAITIFLIKLELSLNIY